MRSLEPGPGDPGPSSPSNANLSFGSSGFSSNIQASETSELLSASEFFDRDSIDTSLENDSSLLSARPVSRGESSQSSQSSQSQTTRGLRVTADIARSISLPNALHLLHINGTGSSSGSAPKLAAAQASSQATPQSSTGTTGATSSAAAPPAPLAGAATKRVLSESRSLDPHRGGAKLQEVAADADSLAIQHNITPDSPTRRRRTSLFNSSHSASHAISLGDTLDSSPFALRSGTSSRTNRANLSTFTTESASKVQGYGYKYLGGAATQQATQQALSCPDILYKIFEEIDTMTVIPHELSQSRRRPLSLRHAQLIFGNTKRALEAWESSTTQLITSGDSSPGGLHSCLLVNRVWRDIAKKVMETNIHFKSNERWTDFIKEGRRHLSRKPKALVLHKLSTATQLELELICDADIGGRLEWLELYTCPGLCPPAELFGGGHIKKLVLPGCGRVNDRTLAHIAAMCPQLEHLDLRACELVTDKGLKVIAKYCSQLQLLNVGRTRNGENITYKGIKHLARQTSVNTLGLAGCFIDDRAIWELAISRGPALQRLSLNNCRLLSDASIPRVLGYMPNLTVLEIRGCLQITHMRPLALFRRYRERQGQPPLIEGCEVLERRIQLASQRLRREISQRILNDCQRWLNTDEDADVLADQFPTTTTKMTLIESHKPLPSKHSLQTISVNQ